MWNLFQQPVEKESFESWGKMCDDTAKVALLALPVILYSKEGLDFRLINIVLLLCATYLFLLGGRICRKKSFKGKKV
ncbi:hypothetical protein [Actinobacillus pleuropneumoniae]|uniref:hypothetical protein n=1 Tax=Actinobacillus pleuropneumoniae TaxID=715 RepID=UPI0001E49387|nr:hypothetical protein [Actinobacillus pleuropneumoniae]EFM93267.1 hypothetical protein appser9_20340 [Actinobacillus pleuropneumoniae serovar 9 str. CVJ13261]EFM97591.1 hypothetical protein appser11_20460 [Actinobacillus pleuropneumoniae serovar 11 str. 56153]MCL7710263.1 hypothetical protein [Actinobacillus pleuropneumoniae]MCL7712560.1 hypothetical protein [Actinobacillus pleuropneumoniae]MCL7716514.1 hypothetical protein [Actinobacillus pleuropneumoniae]